MGFYVNFSSSFCVFLSMVVMGVLLSWICRRGGGGFFFDLICVCVCVCCCRCCGRFLFDFLCCCCGGGGFFIDFLCCVFVVVVDYLCVPWIFLLIIDN